MIELRLSELAQSLGVACETDDAVVTGLAIDSRAVKPGDLFVAIDGEHVDGHDFIDKALDNGTPRQFCIALDPVDDDFAPTVVDGYVRTPWDLDRKGRHRPYRRVLRPGHREPVLHRQGHHLQHGCGARGDHLDLPL